MLRNLLFLNGITVTGWRPCPERTGKFAESKLGVLMQKSSSEDSPSKRTIPRLSKRPWRSPILHRLVGSSSSFKEHAALPKGLDAGPAPPKPSPKPVEKATRDATRDRAAALAYEKEQARREAERRKE